MGRRTTLFVILISLSLGFTSAGAQSVIEQDFREYQRQALTEKLFVHTDKETYVTGETTWFSIFEVDGMFHKLLDFSKAVYVEILDADNRPVLQTKVQIKNGRGWGSLFLPNLLSGRYTFRAYTRWMRNFSPDYFFEKEINIINSVRPNEGTSIEVVDQKDIAIRFFPEGGQLVQNIHTRVAFQATGNNGKGIDISGYIKNEIGDTVARFSTIKFGIGSFSFTPLAGAHYEAITFFGGQSLKHELPVVQMKGYTLSVNALPNGKLHAIISRGGVEGPDTMILFIHTRNKVKVVQATTLKDGKGGFLIDKNKLDEGISHFTIFNGARQPVCERLYFIKPKSVLQPEVTLAKNIFKTREKVTINILAKATDNTQVPATLSVSVYKLDSLQSDSPPNMHHYLMLSSDLKGTIESPEYYFNSTDTLVQDATDNLMLTHGWRRFIWNDVLNGKTAPIPFCPEYEGLVISGTMLQRNNNLPASTNDTYLSFPGIHPQFFTAQTDLKGKFEFLVKNPTGHREVVIQAAQNPAAYTALPDTPFSAEYSNRKITPLLLTDNLKRTVLQTAIHSQAQNYFKEEKINGPPPPTDTLLFYGAPDKTYNLDDYLRFPTLEDVLREYVPEVTVIGKGKRSSPYVVNRSNDALFEDDPLVLVDGVPISSTYRMAAMPAVSVKALEVIAQRYRLGPVAFDGIISLKTDKGRLAGLEPDSGAYAFDFEGLQIEREFYSPVYESSSAQNTRIPDFRSVLYWQPNLETSGSGSQAANFYTSDETGTFIVVVQGVSSGGISGCNTITFKVANP